MNLIPWLRYRALLATQEPQRYANLFRAVHDSGARRLVEIGTWNGVHARQMIETAALRHPVQTVHYFGFDLFEALTDDTLEREFSKRPPARAEVEASLAVTGARVQLFAGDTRTTLPAALPELGHADLVFVDGGHAEDTIASDWSFTRKMMGPRTVVLFDDYYVDPDPQLKGLGCQSLVDGLDPARYAVRLLEPVDAFPQDWGELRIRIAEVRLR